MKWLFSELPVFMGRQSCSSLSLPWSSCRKLDAREQTSTFFSQKAASCLYRAVSLWHLHQKYTQTFSFQQGCKSPFPHLPCMCLEGKVLPHPTSHSASGYFSTYPFMLVLSDDGLKTTVPGLNAEKTGCQNLTAPVWKAVRDVHTCSKARGEGFPQGRPRQHSLHTC